MTNEERFTRLIKALWGISPVFTVLFGLLLLYGVVRLCTGFVKACKEGAEEKLPLTPEEEEMERIAEEEYQKKSEAIDDMIWALYAAQEDARLGKWLSSATCGSCAESELREDESGDSYYYCPYQGYISTTDGDYPHYCEDYDGPGRPC